MASAGNGESYPGGLAREELFVKRGIVYVVPDAGVDDFNVVDFVSVAVYDVAHLRSGWLAAKLGGDFCPGARVCSGSAESLSERLIRARRQLSRARSQDGRPG